MRSAFEYGFRRILRIYPAYLISLLISGLYIQNFHTYTVYPLASKWYSMWFNFKPFTQLIINHLLFTDPSMNTVAWALGPIMLFSLLAPFFYFFYRSISTKWNLLLLTILITISFLVRQNDSIKYLFTFYIGLILPKLTDSLKKIMTNMNFSAKSMGIISIVFLLIARPLFLKNEILIKIVESLAIFSLIFLTINYKEFFLNEVGRSRILVFFGKISYSFYIINFLILYMIANILFKNKYLYDFKFDLILTSLFIGFLSILITTPIAYLIYLFVEKNIIFLNRRLSNRIVNHQ